MFRILNLDGGGIKGAFSASEGECSDAKTKTSAHSR